MHDHKLSHPHVKSKLKDVTAEKDLSRARGWQHWQWWPQSCQRAKLALARGSRIGEFSLSRATRDANAHSLCKNTGVSSPEFKLLRAFSPFRNNAEKETLRPCGLLLNTKDDALRLALWRRLGRREGWGPWSQS